MQRLVRTGFSYPDKLGGLTQQIMLLCTLYELVLDIICIGYLYDVKYKLPFVLNVNRSRLIYGIL